MLGFDLRPRDPELELKWLLDFLLFPSELLLSLSEEPPSLELALE